MPSGKPKWSAWAAWLGVIALALNALVPVHIAFDLAVALGPAHQERAAASGHDLEWRLLALLTGHVDADGKPDRDKHHGSNRSYCPACSALGTLAGFAPTSVTALPVPVTVVAVIAVATIAGEPAKGPAAAYRSRAPPIA
jgi:hypothetical protein